MYVTIELLKDETGKHLFAIDSIRLGKYKPVGIAKTVSKGIILISDIVEAVGREDILEYINNNSTTDK